jgi:ferredoxin-NADP reductase
VIEEGEIGAGDEIVKVADGPERVTVQEIDGLLYLPGHSLNQMQRALRIPSLSAGWRGSLEALVAAEKKHDQSGNAGLSPRFAPHPAWRGFRALRVAAVQRESVDVLSFVFESQDRSPLPAPLPGQFLVFRLQLDEDSVPILRSYSMSGPQAAGTYRVSVKRASGAGSRFFHDRIRAGDLLQVSAPRGSFTLAPGNNPLVLLTAGIGVTPVLAMLHSLAATGTDSTREVWWCYGARNGREHPFAAEARALLNRLPYSQALVAYSKPEDADQQGQDYDASGHLNLSLLQRLQVPKEADFYLCGPTAFLSDFTADLKSWSVPDSRIRFETFGVESSITPGIARTASAFGKRRHRPEDFLYTQRSFGALGHSVWKSARIRGGLRRSCQVVLSDWCLPHVRVRVDRRKGRLRTRAS